LTIIVVVGYRLDTCILLCKQFVTNYY